jgi:glycosyltransferase involved in cell wall biosynthesis
MPMSHCGILGIGHQPQEAKFLPMRVMLFTDTLGDVNGVSRFIRNAAATARSSGRELTVITSTNFAVPECPNIINVPPVWAMKMPGYENLELVLPPIAQMLRACAAFRPDVIHISTPGSVGLVGKLAARSRGVPVVGVYHTDFPAYIERLFGDESLRLLCAASMKLFYRGFSRVLSRSDDYRRVLRGMGLSEHRLHALRPGIVVSEFHPCHRDERVWQNVGTSAGSVRVLSVGRVSVEKNLPMLSAVWRRASEELGRRGIVAELFVVGDGPYRARMEEELSGTSARFLGFRGGKELAALYAGADFFVFPSTTDTLGQVVMESQASGLPVLVSDQGGPKEVVRHGVTGFVLPAVDVAAWAEHIVMLATQDERRAQMGRAAHESMQSYSMEVSFDHFWRVHEQAFAEHTMGERAGGAA